MLEGYHPKVLAVGTLETMREVDGASAMCSPQGALRLQLTHRRPLMKVGEFLEEGHQVQQRKITGVVAAWTR